MGKDIFNLTEKERRAVYKTLDNLPKLKKEHKERLGKVLKEIEKEQNKKTYTKSCCHICSGSGITDDWNGACYNCHGTGEIFIENT